MPPVDDRPGWTPARRDAFRAFHRGRSLDPATAVERTWVIDVNGTAAGAARLERSGDAVEAGVWLSRAVRGRGIGRVVAALLLAGAPTCGAARVLPPAPARHPAARGPPAGLGATLTTAGDEVTAELRLS